MTLEQMVNWIADRDHLHDGPKIIAALKAGQAMRDKYVEDVLGEYGPYTQEELYIRWPEIKAWDAVTKEDI